MKINKDLLWGYDITKLSESDKKSEAFMELYTSKVLTRGTRRDILDLGLDTIKVYLPKLQRRLPPQIREFWNWYFKDNKHLDNP